MNSKILKAKDEKRSERIASALFDNQNMEILKTEGGGYIETEGMEKTYQISQEKLVKEVDINTKQKVYSLTLDQFGPYTVRFDRPGRHLLLAGEKGHLAMVRCSPPEFTLDGCIKARFSLRVPYRRKNL